MNSLQLASLYFRDLDSFMFFMKQFFHEVPETLKYMLEHPYWSLFLMIVCIHIWRDIADYFKRDKSEYYYDYGLDDDTENPPDPPELP